MALSCDIIIAAEDAKMAEFFIRMGLDLDMALYPLPASAVGLGGAKTVALPDDTLSTGDAEQMGVEEFLKYTMLLQYQMSQTEDHKEAKRLFWRIQKAIVQVSVNISCSWFGS